MTYIVTWSVGALTELARITAHYGDPRAVDQAAVWSDYALRRYPMDLGESRDGNERLWCGDVLGILYHVDSIQMKVRVMTVGPARRR